MKLVTGYAVLVISTIVVAGDSGVASLPAAVRIDAGLVSGVAGATPAMRVFKGIPYAAPPVGALRWRSPQPVRAWDGVRAADQFGARCMQPNVGAGGRGVATTATLPMSEDCLYLNVWTEAASAAERRPVIVWSHGGALTIGSGAQVDGEALARKGVVVVALNYRLGPFGFFSHPELTKESGHDASGNYGLMDLVAVLQWVQRNIAAFGGDPTQVTVAGQSGGGRLTRAVVASAVGKGLAHRAISHSAPVRIDRMWTRTESETAGLREAAKVGATTLAELRAKPAEEIQAAMQTGRLVVDGWYVTEDLSIALAEGHQNRVDLLVGSNQDEANFVSSLPASPFFGVDTTTNRQFTDDTRSRFGAKGTAFLDRYPPGTTDDTARASRREAFRDEASWNAREWAAQTHAGGRTAYVYYFVHRPPLAPGQPDRSAQHGAEIPYAFNTPVATWTDVDRRLGEAMSSYWANFVAKSDPNGPGLPQWRAYQPTADERLILGPSTVMGPGLDRVRTSLFDSIAIRPDR